MMMMMVLRAPPPPVLIVDIINKLQTRVFVCHVQRRVRFKVFMVSSLGLAGKKSTRKSTSSS